MMYEIFDELCESHDYPSSKSHKRPKSVCITLKLGIFARYRRPSECQWTLDRQKKYSFGQIVSVYLLSTGVSPGQKLTNERNSH